MDKHGKMIHTYTEINISDNEIKRNELSLEPRCIDSSYDNTVLFLHL
jgi:hypothetical protein